MVTKDRPTGYCRITRRCIAEYYSMGRTRGIVSKVLVDCSWNQSRNTWKYENVAPVVFGNLGRWEYCLVWSEMTSPTRLTPSLSLLSASGTS